MSAGNTMGACHANMLCDIIVSILLRQQKCLVKDLTTGEETFFSIFRDLDRSVQLRYCHQLTVICQSINA